MSMPTHLYEPRESYPFLMEDSWNENSKPTPSRVIVINAKELGGDFVKKGVSYTKRGNKVQCCKFCHIVATCSNEVIYEEEDISVFRPLHPANESHILIVPKQHVRNINHLTSNDLSLLVRMKEVAGLILGRMGYHSFNSEMHLSFHRPPFNSIDHVHMHAMIQDIKGNGKLSRMNFVGSVKYSTGTWWCKSYDNVYSRLAKQIGTDTIRSTKTTRMRTKSDMNLSERRQRQFSDN